MRPIDADAVVERLQRRSDMFSFDKRYEAVMRDAIGEVLITPAIDAVPVVHARWIEDGYRGIPCVCSHCGEDAHYTSTFQEKFDYDWDENLVSCGYEEIREYIRSKRCHECGARMDGEADD